MLTLRRATADDAPFLREMLAVSADWRPDAPVRTTSEVMAEPELAHYVLGWPRDGDVGVVAQDSERPVGAAWWRFFGRDDPGYGFIDAMTPELAIGVAPETRGRGVGTRLLTALMDEARELGVPALSLSVEAENPAAQLYRRLGFREVGTVGGSLTMIVHL